MSNVVIFKNKLLTYSETFIKEQGESLPNFKPIYFCTRKAEKSIDLPRNRFVAVVGDGFFGKVIDYLFIKNIIRYFHIRKLRNLNPILIHSHFGIDGVLIQESARDLKCPLLVTFHGYDITTHDKYAAKSFIAHREFPGRCDELIANAAGFIAVSKFIERKLIQRGFPKERIYQHYIGVDLSKFAPSDIDFERSDGVLFVGRLVEKKGCRYLLHAFKLVQERYPDSVLKIVGDGPLKAELMALAEQLELRNYHFLGVQSHQEVRDHMSASRVFCVPSVEAASGDSEAFGMVFAEAQAIGVPVVSTTHGGIPEVVLHGITGLLAEPGDVIALAEHLATLYSSRTLWESYRVSGMKHVSKSFDIRRQALKLEGIYRSIIEISC